MYTLRPTVRYYIQLLSVHVQPVRGEREPVRRDAPRVPMGLRELPRACFACGPARHDGRGERRGARGRRSGSPARVRAAAQESKGCRLN